MEHDQSEYLNKDDLKKIFRYGRDKMKKFLESGCIPVVKVNDDYLITRAQLDAWFRQNAGKKIKI